MNVHYVPVSHCHRLAEGTGTVNKSINSAQTPRPLRPVRSPVGGHGRRERVVMRLRSDIVRDLPDERLMRIDVNGSLAGTVLALADAPEELAVGWAFIHGFLDATDTLDRVTVEDDRISIMVANGEDIDRRRLEAVGWAKPESLSLPESDDRELRQIDQESMLDVIDATWQAFRSDDGGDGYVQAAVASGDAVSCVARDRHVDVVTAKIFGWVILTAQEDLPQLLLVRGMIGRRIVESAARLGVPVVIGSGVPTAEALRAAQGLPLSLVAMATSRTVGLLVDGGHIITPGMTDDVRGENHA